MVGLIAGLWLVCGYEYLLVVVFSGNIGMIRSAAGLWLGLRYGHLLLAISMAGSVPGCG